MHNDAKDRRRPRAPALACLTLVILMFALAGARGALAATTGKIQGKIVATDSGEALGYADVALLPADTTMHRVAGMANADGTFLLEAAPGRYSLQIRALSYAPKHFDVVIEAGKLLPFDAALTPEAIQQKEVVVEARSVQSTEASLLAARKKAAAVGDAVSAEQVRKSADKNAAEVLRRVTGLTVSDGKYVYVRGLGERYSSTEVDGVRLASPEENKRVVPLDLVPSNLLDNIVVQKTYTADRPGEFGGGDVQVHTKDFPGKRIWSVAFLQGYAAGVTFEPRRTYASTGADVWGFGSAARAIPDEVYDVAGNRPLILSSNPANGYPKSTLAQVGKSFENVWSPASADAVPNGAYSGTYGDELKVLGRSLGVIGSFTYGRSFEERNESQRLFAASSDTIYDYAVQRDKESVLLGGLAGLSYRMSPSHSIHLRTLYTNSADDEVRTYQGPDHNRVEAQTGTWLVHRDTRLMYVQRSVLSGTIEGRHDLARLLGTSVDWKFTRSLARREQPDRRETVYDRGYYPDANGNLIEYWALGSTGSREYGDLKDNGWGTTLSGSVPYRLGRLGSGKAILGYDRQSKHRENFYRRFNLYPNQTSDRTLTPEGIFTPANFDGSASTAYVDEGTLAIDNYRADQLVTAGYLTVDVPLGTRLRANAGVRAEHGTQDVKSFDLFNPQRITSEGSLDNVDWLPSGNLTWAVTSTTNLRLGASRTLSRPDLNELSPSPSLDYIGGMRVSGNPNLHRAQISNYDARVEMFPSLSEVLAVGYFYKYLLEPIEQTIQGGTPPLLVPRNSDHGTNQGVEFELRSSLGRGWDGLKRLSINTNAAIISSNVLLKPQLTVLGTMEHPLQGQADYVVNAGLTYATPSAMTDVSILYGLTGRRLKALGYDPEPDIYEQPSASLDVAMNLTPFRGARLKATAKNLLDPLIQQLQGGKEVSSYRTGRSYAVALTYEQ